MTCKPGRLARLEVSPDDGVTYLNVGGAQELNLSGTIDSLECTNFDTVTGARSFIPNYHTETLDGTFNRDFSNPGQLVIAQTLTNPEQPFKIRFYLQKGQGYLRFDAEAFVTSHNLSHSRDSLATFDFTLQLSNTRMVLQLS